MRGELIRRLSAMVAMGWEMPEYIELKLELMLRRLTEAEPAPAPVALPTAELELGGPGDTPPRPPPPPPPGAAPPPLGVDAVGVEAALPPPPSATRLTGKERIANRLIDFLLTVTNRCLLLSSRMVSELKQNTSVSDVWYGYPLQSPQHHKIVYPIILLKKKKLVSLQFWILETQPLDTCSILEMSHGRAPECASSTIFWRVESGSGRPLTYTPPSWLMPEWPAAEQPNRVLWATAAAAAAAELWQWSSSATGTRQIGYYTERNIDN
ncbi:hypothetical protein FOCC_FOCC008779 [Frankliniella occidentalis]|nr:hypothetical protein FOCC_FOCC008779 [Frankliniella occidentalis]